MGWGLLLLLGGAGGERGLVKEGVGHVGDILLDS